MDNKLVRWTEGLKTRISNVITPAMQGKKNILRQIGEMLRLVYGATKLTPAEYYWYSLFDAEIYREADLDAFCGSHMKQWLHQQLNSPLWDAVVTDKFIMSTVFKSAGIPHPETYAVACRFPRNCGTTPMITSSEELCMFIRQEISYPFFCKPIKGGSARGCNRVESKNPGTDTVVLADGSELEVEDFVRQLDDPTGWGYIFQEAVKAHPQTREICGAAVSGCRVVMLLDDDGAYPFRVTWKVPAGGNYTDNYVHGEAGNLLADIDLDTGVAVRVVSGSGMNLRIDPRHPDTGAKVLGVTLPDWEKLTVQMRDAALAFPGFRIQHWDVGLTAKGPIVYELNTAGDPYVVELSKGSGLYNAELKAFMAKVAESGRRSKFIGAPVSSLNDAV